jgi:hypothetical protein
MHQRQPDPWRACAVVFALTVIISILAVVAALAALDPYDTSRFGNSAFWRGRIDDDRTSRGRDPLFNAAIIGNSRSALIEPAILDRGTGLHFVSLVIYGSQPIEELAVLRYFIGHHPDAGAVVIGLDDAWCKRQLQSGLGREFPHRLYEDGIFGYLAQLYTFRTVQRAWRARRSVDARADGFQDYEPAFRAAGQDAIEVARQKLPVIRPGGLWHEKLKPLYPALSQLTDVFAKMSASTAVVLAWVPVHISGLPLPNSTPAELLAACQSAYAAVAAARPRTEIINWWLDRPENRVDGNFYDQGHYRRSIAVALDDDITAKLVSARAASEPGGP